MYSITLYRIGQRSASQLKVYKQINDVVNIERKTKNNATNLKQLNYFLKP